MPLGIPILSCEDGRRLVEYKPSSNNSINKGRWTKEEVSVKKKNYISYIKDIYKLLIKMSDLIFVFIIQDGYSMFIFYIYNIFIGYSTKATCRRISRTMGSHCPTFQ